MAVKFAAVAGERVHQNIAAGLGRREHNDAPGGERGARLAHRVAGGGAEGEAFEFTLGEAVTRGDVGGLAAHGADVALGVVEELLGDGRGIFGVEALGFGGGLGGGEVGAHEREEAAELHAVHRVGGAHGPLAGEVELRFELPAFGFLIAVVARAEELVGGREEIVEFGLHGGAEAEGVVLRGRVEAREGGVDAVLQEIEAQAPLMALAGAGEAGTTGEFEAHAVGEERGFEVAGAEREPREHAEHPAVGLVGGVGAVEWCVRNIIAGGVEDRTTLEVDELGAPDDRHGDRRAVAVLAEIIATDAGAGVQAAAEKGAERRQIAGAERLVEARLPGATAEEVGDAGNEFEAQGFVAVAVGQVVDRVDDVVGEGGSGAGEAAARDFLLREREGEGVEVVLFVTITGARDRAEGGVPEGQLGIVNGGTPPARGLVAVVGERGRVGEEELLEARIGNRGVGDGGMGKNAVDVDEDGAGIHAEGAGGGIGLQAGGVVDLAVMGDEEAEVIAQLMRELDIVGVEIGVVPVVGARPVLAVRIDAVGNRGERIAQGILRVDAGGDGGAGEDGGVAVGRGGG